MALPRVHRRLPPLLAAALAVLGLLLAAPACSRTRNATDWFFGNALVMRVAEVRHLEEVRFSDEGKHFVIRPSQEGRGLVAARLEVRNREANIIYFNITQDSIRLRDSDFVDYKALDPFAQRTEVAESKAPENMVLPFIWGKVELPKTCGEPPQGCQLTGWVLFEAPPTARVNQVVWEAADTVYMHFE